jgi:acetyltransferase-like isoleucine patch superfamily enzyme
MKRWLKPVLTALGVVCALPFVLWARLGLLAGRPTFFIGAAQAVAPWPGLPGRLLRRGFYCLVLPECSWDVNMHLGVVVSHPEARIGRRVSIGNYGLIGTCRIGDDALIASRVSILSGRYPHRFDDLDQTIALQQGEYSCVDVGRDVWLGEGCIVMADVGPQAVVGAGSVVVKPVPERAIVAGNPARVLRTRGEAAS